MTYLFLLYADESTFPAPGSPELQAQLEAYGAFYELVSGKGAFKAGDPLQRSSSATTVSCPRRAAIDHRRRRRSPGGEQIIGFYVLEVGSDAEAVELAAKIPAAAHGRVEARPILVM